MWGAHNDTVAERCGEFPVCPHLVLRRIVCPFLNPMGTTKGCMSPLGTTKGCVSDPTGYHEGLYVPILPHWLLWRVVCPSAPTGYYIRLYVPTGYYEGLYVPFWPYWELWRVVCPCLTSLATIKRCNYRYVKLLMLSSPCHVPFVISYCQCVSSNSRFVYIWSEHTKAIWLD